MAASATARRSDVEGQIGTAAGIVWGHLTERRPSMLSQLRRASKLPDPLLLMARGWLAREGRLAFEGSKRDLRIGLMGQ
jgi:hypothetical protein